jgi:hypothetical protein
MYSLCFFALLGGDPLRFGLDLGGALAVGRRVERDDPGFRRFPRLPVERRLEHGAQREVVGLRDRIVTVVVTLGAGTLIPKQRRTRRSSSYRP